MGKELSPQEIAALVAGIGKRGRRSDSSEPRTTENWWKQTHHLLYRPDNPDLDIKCSNPDCSDYRPEDKAILLGEIKGTLMCRYCFLNGYLSD
jgi:hypothetical protein